MVSNYLPRQKEGASNCDTYCQYQANFLTFLIWKGFLIFAGWTLTKLSLKNILDLPKQVESLRLCSWPLV